MKRILPLLLIASFLLCLCGCTQQQPEPKDGSRFYYPRVSPTFGSADSVITYEVRDPDIPKNDYVNQLTLYFLGPQSEELKNVFPSGVSAVSVNVGQNMVFVVLSDLFAQLSGLELTLACACLTLTLSGLTGVETVQIKAQTLALDGNNVITMNASELLLLDSLSS